MYTPDLGPARHVSSAPGATAAQSCATSEETAECRIYGGVPPDVARWGDRVFQFLLAKGLPRERGSLQP